MTATLGTQKGRDVAELGVSCLSGVVSGSLRMIRRLRFLRRDLGDEGVIARGGGWEETLGKHVM